MPFYFLKKDSDKSIELKGKDAIVLWLKGKDTWNAWVKANPKANINFDNIKFWTLRLVYPDLGDTISFRGFNFPEGDVSFNNTSFHTFDADFSNINFSKGEISFFRSIFSEGRVNFSNTNFEDGDVIFSDTIFNSHKVTFNDSNFGEGCVYFCGSIFGTCIDNLERGEVHFSNINYGDGSVHFSHTTFHSEYVTFSDSKIDNGKISFNDSKINSKWFLFEKNKINGHTSFNRIECQRNIKTFSFKHSTFGDSLDISIKELDCVPDFTNTKITNQIVLNNLNYQLKRERHFLIFKISDYRDIALLRRLKEIAEGNKDYASILRFHADEMRAKRWNELSPSQSILDMFFSLSCNYGQSIARPLFSLLSLILIKTLYTIGYCFPLTTESTDYSTWMSNMNTIDNKMWLRSFELAISNALPFISSSKEISKNAYEHLHLTFPAYIGIVNLLYGISCFLLLFLIGVGLRNRFKI
ncbi:hypothetical protein [Photobacterium leiognathi]|uniref:hypothetical protein n=1 Tax=Photobacterium leiognathi TaxID=553611 RepID=UPI002982521C|nr:hypothetical protein [Photobacterium leiognathi]